jgi:uncharacterized protein
MFTLKQFQVLQQTENFVEDYMKAYDWSHDYDHVIRVKNTATSIGISLNLSTDDIFEIQLGALLHDINDNKYACSGPSQAEIIEDFLRNKLEKDQISSIVMIACNTSLSKEMSSSCQIQNVKLDCVRDADRIDSLGAFGISRYLKYGITKNNNNLQNIIENLETRTSLLVPRIRTDYAKSILEKKLNLIKLFVEDYYQSI